MNISHEPVATRLMIDIKHNQIEFWLVFDIKHQPDALYVKTLFIKHQPKLYLVDV